MIIFKNIEDVDKIKVRTYKRKVIKKSLRKLSGEFYRNPMKKIGKIKHFFFWLTFYLRNLIINYIIYSFLDIWDRAHGSSSNILAQRMGENPKKDSKSVAIFVHFSVNGGVSEMVERQARMYGELGFAVLLVSNSPVFPICSRQSAHSWASMIIHRKNTGLDFGGWKDAIPVALEFWKNSEEILLINDSVIGPIYPLGPIFEQIRKEGDGFFGLVESIQGGLHMQSWFNFAKGKKAISDLSMFFSEMRLSRSKSKIIKRGEIMLAKSMRDRGNRVAALYSYSEMVDLGLCVPAERAYLQRALPQWFVDGDDVATRTRFMAWPINPTHQLWRVLAGPGRCPFIKTELVRKNPVGLPDLEKWQEFVSEASPISVEIIKNHLNSLDGQVK